MIVRVRFRSIRVSLGCSLVVWLMVIISLRACRSYVFLLWFVDRVTLVLMTGYPWRLSFLCVLFECCGLMMLIWFVWMCYFFFRCSSSVAFDLTDAFDVGLLIGWSPCLSWVEGDIVNMVAFVSCSDEVTGSCLTSSGSGEDGSLVVVVTASDVCEDLGMVLDSLVASGV